MFCPRCGTKNKQQTVYCEKCLLPLKHGTEDSALFAYSGRMSFSNIMVIVLCAVMALALIVFPMFSDGIYDIINFGVKSKDSILEEIKNEVSKHTSFGTEQFLGIILPIIAMGFSIVVTVIGAVTKKYVLQNFASFTNLLFAAPLMIYVGTRLQLYPHIGCCLYIVLSVAVMYFTQNTDDKKNVVVLIGLGIVGLGALVALIGYFTNDNSFITNLEDVSRHHLAELFGMIVTVIGGIVAIVGFEVALFRESEHNKKAESGVEVKRMSV